MPPRDLEDILDDAEDVRAQTWKRAGVFEVLESTVGTAIICPLSQGRLSDVTRGIVRYSDGVLVDLDTGTLMEMRGKCENALRERPVTMKTLDLEEESAPKAPIVEEDPFAEADPFASTERPMPPPRRWNTVPISSGQDE